MNEMKVMEIFGCIKEKLIKFIWVSIKISTFQNLYSFFNNIFMFRDVNSFIPRQIMQIIKYEIKTNISHALVNI